MGLSEVLGIVIIILLLTLILLQITGRKKTDLGEIRLLLKHASDEQRESVQKQIANSTTEQFERFGFIQKSIQDTLSSNRKEVNYQLGEFQKHMSSQLSDIQKSGMENNLEIGKSVTRVLQESRAEQFKQLHLFGEQVDKIPIWRILKKSIQLWKSA